MLNILVCLLSIESWHLAVPTGLPGFAYILLGPLLGLNGMWHGRAGPRPRAQSNSQQDNRRHAERGQCKPAAFRCKNLLNYVARLTDLAEFRPLACCGTTITSFSCHVMEAKTHQSDKFTAPTPDELLKHFPARIRESYARFVATRDPAAADEVVIAIVRDHVPAKKLAGTPATSRTPCP